MYQQMTKNVLEVKNYLKETLKGSLLENFAKTVYHTFKSQEKIDFVINRQDNALTVEILNRILTKESNCIDIGCNTGEFLIPISQIASLGHHYAFEPIPRLANRLRKKFPNIDVREIAVSDTEGEATFWYVVNAPALSSLQHSHWNNHSPDAITEQLTVKTQKLDDILPPDFKVHLIKVDVEGAEMQVFQGGMRTLKNHKPYVIFEEALVNIQDENVRHNVKVYDFLVGECELQIFELKNWLEDLAPLSRDEFLKTHSWNFIAAAK
ncbi:MAG: FkbM family methyltransferase [Nostocaceae cyanobacterium]|nr:FkbM family methyltransferase [Nostocaceae cyanobacterium]